MESQHIHKSTSPENGISPLEGDSTPNIVENSCIEIARQLKSELSTLNKKYAELKNAQSRTVNIPKSWVNDIINSFNEETDD